MAKTGQFYPEALEVQYKVGHIYCFGCLVGLLDGNGETPMVGHTAYVMAQKTQL